MREVRRQIVAVRLQPGDRVPSHVALEQRFHASANAVLRAMKRLERDGFVVSQRRRGMFVATRLPHLTDYALVFPHDPGADPSWSRLYAVLANAAVVVGRTAHCRIRLFYGTNKGEQAGDYRRLLELVEGQCLAGLIFAFYPHELRTTPIIKLPGLPRVALASGHNPDGLQMVDATTGSFFNKALAWLASRQRRRIALVTHSRLDLSADFESRLAAYGVETRRCWSMAGSEDAPATVRAFVELLMRLPAMDRPDGLVITDDNLVEPAAAGLVDAAVRVGVDLDVVARCNFPWAGASAVPVKRLGYDARELLEVSLDLINRQRRGEPVPSRTEVQAVFEEDTREPSATVTLSARQPVVGSMKE